MSHRRGEHLSLRSFFKFFLANPPPQNLYRSTTCPQSRMSHKSSAVCSASHPWPTDRSLTANELLDGAERGGTRSGMEVGLPRHQSLRREIVLSLGMARAPCMCTRRCVYMGYTPSSLAWCVFSMPVTSAGRLHRCWGFLSPQRCSRLRLR